MKSSRCVNTAATLQAVYLVWLFLRITTMCNLSVFELVHKKFLELFVNVQTVDTRPLFPLTTWPGYKASVVSHKWTSDGVPTFQEKDSKFHTMNFTGNQVM